MIEFPALNKSKSSNYRVMPRFSVKKGISVNEDDCPFHAMNKTRKLRVCVWFTPLQRSFSSRSKEVLKFSEELFALNTTKSPVLRMSPDSRVTEVS